MRLIWKITAVALILCILFLASCDAESPTTRTVQVVKREYLKCKTVEIPYQAREEYKVDFDYEIVEVYRQKVLHGLDVWAQSVVKIRNTDTETGDFIVKQRFETVRGDSEELKSIERIMPGDTQAFKEEYDINAGDEFDVHYKVLPAQKILERTVTKHKQEERCEYVYG